MLEVVGLYCSRNDNVLFSDLNFILTPGDILQILAANGVGKTTLLKIIAGLFPVAAGKILNNNSLIFLGHKNNLHPALSMFENLKFLSAIHSNTLTRQQLTTALHFAGLSAVQNIVCGELSAGQCQRINLALLYVTNAKLWLLDEPFINLDSQGRAACTELIAKHVTNGGMLIIATHTDLKLTNKSVKILELEKYA
jgi:heme exporter protein A